MFTPLFNRGQKSTPTSVIGTFRRSGLLTAKQARRAQKAPRIAPHVSFIVLPAIPETESFQLPQAFVQTLPGFQRVTSPELAIDLFNLTPCFVAL